MTEHVHEWTWFHYDGYYHCQVTGCNEKRHPIEMEPKIKATEVLSAKTVRNLLEAYKTGMINMYFAMTTIRSTLKAYTDILEGKDG